MSNNIGITINDFGNICRTCLSREDLKPLYEKCVPSNCLAEMLICCTSVKFAEDDGLPENICTNCIQEINQAFLFAKRCEIIETILRKCLKQSENELANNLTQSQKVEPINKTKKVMEIIIQPEINVPKNINRKVEVFGDYEYVEEKDEKMKITSEESMKQEELLIEHELDENDDDLVNKSYEEGDDESYFEKSDNPGSTFRFRPANVPIEKISLKPEDSPPPKQRCKNLRQIKSNPLYYEDPDDDYEDQDETYSDNSDSKCKVHLKLPLNISRKVEEVLNDYEYVEEKEQKMKIKYEESVKQEELLIEDELDENYDDSANKSYEEGDDKSYSEKSDNPDSTSRSRPTNLSIEKTSSKQEDSPPPKQRYKNLRQMKSKPSYYEDPIDDYEDQDETYSEKFDNSVSKRKVHLKAPNDAHPHTCKCGQTFKFLHILKAHEQIHNKGARSQQAIVCSVCSKSFKKYTNFKNHMRIHTGHKPYICEVCNKSFIQSHHLKTHKRLHTGEKPYTCKICNRSFTDKRNLKCHMRIHTGEKPYTCEVCSKSFTQVHHLKGHMRQHTGEKPYTCTVCSRTFAQSTSLKCHMRLHTGEKPYTCKFCSKTFTQPTSLKFHTRTHTGEKPYTCNVCSRDFSILQTLKIHLKIHTRKMPYTCNVCSKCFTSLKTLRVHKRLHTDNKDTPVAVATRVSPRRRR